MVQAGRRAAELQKLYLSGTRKKCRCSARTRAADVMGKTRAGKFYPPASGSIPRRLPPLRDGRSQIRRGGGQCLRVEALLSDRPARSVSAQDVRRCTRDRRRANCGAGSVQQRWPRDIGASGERGDVRRGGPRCFRRYRAPRSGAPTSWPTSEVPSFCEPPRGGLQAGRCGANACPRLASSASFVPTPVS